MADTPYITLIAATDLNGVIGNVQEDGKAVIPWRIPSDQQMFKKVTMGHDVTMGRVTYFSFPKSVRPLPGRHNIVLTRDNELDVPGATIAHSIEEAINAANTDNLFVAGGQDIYASFMKHADRILLTRVHAAVEGNRFFPHIPERTFRLKNLGVLKQEEGDEHPYSILEYERTS